MEKSNKTYFDVDTIEELFKNEPKMTKFFFDFDNTPLEYLPVTRKQGIQQETRLFMNNKKRSVRND